MRNIVLSAIIITLGFTLAAQPAQTASKEKMKVFSSWIGHWQGEGWMQMGPGEPKKSTVDETITSKLDGTVLLVEGIGKSINTTTQQETIIHHALGCSRTTTLRRNTSSKAT